MMSTTNTDYWTILGLEPDSNLVQIKKAFRKEARRWHPDLNVNDINAEERFKLINEAYAVLSDPKKRMEWEESNKQFSSLIDPFIEGFPKFEDYLDYVLGIKAENSNTSYRERKQRI